MRLELERGRAGDHAARRSSKSGEFKVGRGQRDSRGAPHADRSAAVMAISPFSVCYSAKLVARMNEECTGARFQGSTRAARLSNNRRAPWADELIKAADNRAVRDRANVDNFTGMRYS
jgi:hypothetical protein